MISRKCKFLIAIMLLIMGIISCSVGANHFSSPDTYFKSIQSLDEKKMQVTALAGAAAIASTALSAIPGDATTPIANEIAEIASSLCIVVGAIYLEKFLLTIIGLASFRFIIPFACLLGTIYVCFNKRRFGEIAVKIGILGLVLAFIIPASVKLGDMMYETHKASIEQAIIMADEFETEEVETETVIVETEKNEEGWLNSVKNWGKNVVDTATDTITNVLPEKLTELRDNAQKALSDFIDAVAIFIIATCIIPIAVLFFAVWLINIIFNTNLRMPNLKKSKEQIKSHIKKDKNHATDISI